jgi:SAM-dependent methyltransferase
VFSEEFSKIYDLIYKKKKYDLEVRYYLKLLNFFFLRKYKKCKLLDLGCGTGKHINFFLKKGINVYGVERSKYMSDQIKKNKNLKIINKDIRKIKLNKKFDIITALFDVICYFTTKNDINIFFSIVSKHLKKNGVFLCDFWNKKAVYKSLPRSKIIRIKNKNFIIERLSTPKMNGNIFKIIFDFKVKDLLKNQSYIFREKHMIRPYDPQFLINCAKKYNLTIIQSYEFLKFKKPDHNSWKACIVLIKK